MSIKNKDLYINKQILGIDIDDFTCGLVSVLNCLRYLTKKKDSGIDYKQLHEGLYYSSDIEAINRINLCVKRTYKTLKNNKIELPMIVTVLPKDWGCHSVAIVGHDVENKKLLVPNIGSNADENMWVEEKELIEILDTGFNCFVIGIGKKNFDNTKYQC